MYTSIFFGQVKFAYGQAKLRTYLSNGQVKKEKS